MFLVDIVCSCLGSRCVFGSLLEENVVILIDTSGSMDEDDNNRIDRAKEALTNLFASGRIEEQDMVGLFTYNGCYVNQTVPFTKELSQVQAAVDRAGANGGFFAARASANTWPSSRSWLGCFGR